MTEVVKAGDARHEEAAEGRPFEGLLVEIKGVAGKVDIDPYMQDTYLGETSLDINGERGCVVGWLEEQRKYMVHTFSGLFIPVAEEHLVEFEPKDPEDTPQGFDIAWPHAPQAQDNFAAVVAERVNEKGFCVIQMFLGDGGSAEVLETCKELTWGILKQDVEEDYLGMDLLDSKVSWLSYEPHLRENQAMGMKTYDLEDLGPDMSMDGMGALARCDKNLTNTAALIWPYTPDFEDDKAFMTWGRTSTLVRASMEPEDVGVRKVTVGTDDSDELEHHLAYVDSKKLCMLLLVENSGGELSLVPALEAYDYNEVVLPLSKNKLVIFRCDSLGFSYSYQPKGKNLAMQTWVLDTPATLKEKEEALRVIDGPEEPQGQRNNIMSMHTRYPGCSFEPQAFWNMLVSGSDTQVYMPIQRWDADIYYRKEHTIGFSMTCHGALIQQSELEQFDNKFFGISAEEAMTMAPYMRCVLEVGYETLHRAGHRREQLKGWNCGVFIGDSGSDWDTFAPNNAATRHLLWAGRERSAACTRLSHIMGMVGPTCTAETACSSSLVACGVAQQTMRTRKEDQDKPHLSTDLQHGLVIGSNTLIGPMSYISLSGPGMLTHQGRCFTFDASADGFARGEGIGGVKLKVCNDAVDAVGRVAMLIGCCVNQDGRSASMTAPHGPSQQDVIRASMREAGLSPNMITIAECHGTGTALGDPIEIGALRGVMRSDREVPILKTSAKTNIGHLEAAAGIAGLIKCINMLNYSVGVPNVHLITLNPHLDVQGYPVYFETELVDYGSNSGLTGVSSFGFGGTNARADVWGHASKGHRFCITGLLLHNLSRSVAY